MGKLMANTNNNKMGRVRHTIKGAKIKSSGVLVKRMKSIIEISEEMDFGSDVVFIILSFYFHFGSLCLVRWVHVR